MKKKVKIETQTNERFLKEISKVAHNPGGSNKQLTNTNMCVEINKTKVSELVCLSNVLHL